MTLSEAGKVSKIFSSIIHWTADGEIDRMRMGKKKKRGRITEAAILDIDSFKLMIRFWAKMDELEDTLNLLRVMNEA